MNSCWISSLYWSRFDLFWCTLVRNFLQYLMTGSIESRPTYLVISSMLNWKAAAALSSVLANTAAAFLPKLLSTFMQLSQKSCCFSLKWFFTMSKYGNMCSAKNIKSLWSVSACSMLLIMATRQFSHVQPMDVSPMHEIAACITKWSGNEAIIYLEYWSSTQFDKQVSRVYFLILGESHACLATTFNSTNTLVWIDFMQLITKLRFLYSITTLKLSTSSGSSQRMVKMQLMSPSAIKHLVRYSSRSRICYAQCMQRQTIHRDRLQRMLVYGVGFFAIILRRQS